MKRKLQNKLSFFVGLLVILIGILLVYAQMTGAYVLIGFGFGYMLTAFSSQEKMSQVVEDILSHSDLIFFRVFEFLSILLIFKEGYTMIGIVALLSLFFVEILCRKRKEK